jgi:hypothetical protein
LYPIDIFGINGLSGNKMVKRILFVAGKARNANKCLEKH